MHTLSNQTRRDSQSTARSQTGSLQSSIEAQQFSIKDLIRKANLIPLPLLLLHYGLKIDEFNRKLICPFPTHQNGHESTPSFNFYPETNSFWCFGCKTGQRAVDFVIHKENISPYQAAKKILELWGSEIFFNELVLEQAPNYQERLEILLEFSSHIRERMQTANGNKEEIDCIEQITFSFDRMNEKYSLDNAKLQQLVNELKGRLT